MTIKRRQFRAIGATIEKLTKPVFGRRGFSRSAILNQWPDIIGASLAAHSLPEKITYPRDERANGALHIRIASSALALEFQHLEPQLIDRINTYFGYRAIQSLKIIQGPIPERGAPPPPPRRALSAGEKTALDARLNVITDPDIKAALSSLGESIITKPSSDA